MMAVNTKDAKTPDDLIRRLKIFVANQLKKIGNRHKLRGTTIDEIRADAIELASKHPSVVAEINATFDDAKPRMAELIKEITDEWLKDPTQNIMSYAGCGCCYDELSEFEQKVMPELIEKGLFDHVYMDDPDVLLEAMKTICERLTNIEDKLDRLLTNKIH